MSHPDVPLEKYAAGHLGIVHPSFARSYLVVAYRYFSAVPLSKDEQFGALALHNGTAKPFVPAPPAFLTPEQIKQAAAERATLDAADSQANYYAKVAIEFAQKHPDDPRVPESLSRAVKNTDRNCNNPRTSALSKKAFTLLHNKYPNTSWAKNTKYWY